MKALTLWQPWATLMAIGAKRWETRSWRMAYRGPLAIYAAAKTPKSVVEWFEKERHVRGSDAWMMDLGLHAGGFPRELVYGAVLCTLVVIDCVPVEEVGALSPMERACGNFTPGRWAIMTNDLCPLPEPIPAKGRQGLWKWERIDAG